MNCCKLFISIFILIFSSQNPLLISLIIGYFSCHWVSTVYIIDGLRIGLVHPLQYNAQSHNSMYVYLILYYIAFFNHAIGGSRIESRTPRWRKLFWSVRGVCRKFDDEESRMEGLRMIDLRVTGSSGEWKRMNGLFNK